MMPTLYKPHCYYILRCPPGVPLRGKAALKITSERSIWQVRAVPTRCSHKMRHREGEEAQTYFSWKTVFIKTHRIKVNMRIKEQLQTPKTIKEKYQSATPNSSTTGQTMKMRVWTANMSSLISLLILFQDLECTT